MEVQKAERESTCIGIDCAEGKREESRKVWPSFWKGWWESLKQIDAGKLTFSFKVGFAVLLTSLLILVRLPSQVFGPNAVWAAITVVVVFEYTVGATLNRGFNRTLGSIAAGVLALLIAQLAVHAGQVVKPLVVGTSIFIVGTLTAFMKQHPAMKEYEYGFRVVSFTFCLIIASAYTSSNPVRTSLERLYAISIGGVVAMLVNVLIFPCWAGDELHNHLVSNFDRLADALQEYERRNPNESAEEEMQMCETVGGSETCKAVLVSTTEESLANFAKWEPPHGKFWNVFYPWGHYIKLGTLVRHCAYQIVALQSSTTQSEDLEECQAKTRFEREMTEARMQATAIIRELGSSLRKMERCPRETLVARAERLADVLEISIHSWIHYYESLLRSCKKGEESVGAEELLTKPLHRSFTSLDVIGGTDSDEVALVVRAVKNASLMLGFVQKLDHLIDGVYKLGRVAGFKSMEDCK
eukprot:TRINITY_DN2940_c0_g1_i1.p1 TRINITY_DN2940_c0_g1~~TRINITY_DN2940_c0_g1_i1.p1  ORF type:complete len:499 (-),score=40.62 TRINITY_DN2940_c0_g1_i1:179-1585(-)